MEGSYNKTLLLTAGIKMELLSHLSFITNFSLCHLYITFDSVRFCVVFSVTCF